MLVRTGDLSTAARALTSSDVWDTNEVIDKLIALDPKGRSQNVIKMKALA